MDTLAWEQVAALRPRLRNHIRTTRHVYRGRTWFILSDEASGRHLRYPDRAHALVARLDGRRSIEEIYREIQPPGRFSREEVLRLLGELHTAGLVLSELPLDGEKQFQQAQTARTRARRRMVLRPLMLRFPLVDPDRWLTASVALVRPLFCRSFILVWLVLMSASLFLAWVHWPELVEHWSARALDPTNLLLMWLCYPVVKALHELGHGYATKVWGGEVHEMGIMLLVFIPVPYVDASAASMFSRKRRRMIVGAAGILVEMLLAAVALLVWLNAQPGLVRDMAFNIAVIGGVSTLLFNGNPLLRFDGYYVLADAIEIPNLSSRANRYLGYLAKRYLFGLQTVSSPVNARGERSWFLFYGVAAAVYRLFIGLSIALYVAGKFFVIGVLLALVVMVSQVLLPIIRLASYLVTDPQLTGVRSRALYMVAAGVILTLTTLAWLPLPSSTRAEGIVRIPDQSLLRAAEPGFFLHALQPTGPVVSAGTPLVRMESPWLSARSREQQGYVEELRARQLAELVRDPGRAYAIAQQLQAAVAEQQELRQRLASLILPSPVRGRFSLPGAEDMPGRYVNKGDVLGYVTPEHARTVRVAVPQAVTDQVRRHTIRVELMRPGRPQDVLQGRLEGEVPLLDRQLPDRRLGSTTGGDIAVDSRDQSGLHTMIPISQFDIGLLEEPLPGFFGDRIHVRFIHHPEPLAIQWFRYFRRLFLARLSV